MLALVWIMGTVAFAQHTHQYHNGICQDPSCPRTAEGHFETPEQAEDGYYELRNAGHVEWLSQRVADAKIDDYARLMNDIDFEGIENLHNPIGPDNGKKYNGVFDGQGFRIKNMIINRPDAERQGFFGDLRGNPNGSHGEATVIKNLIIDKSCSILGKHKVAGLVASGQNSDMEIYIINCVNEASVTAINNNVGGILGGSDSNHPKWQIINCVNAGRIESKAGGPEAAAIATWAGDNAGTRIENCLNVGEIVGMDGSGRNLFRHSGSLTARNNYDFSEGQEGVQGFDHEMEPSALGSGELCYHMNGDQLEIVWYQRLGTDAYPIPLFLEGGQVYAQGTLNCDGTPASTTFTNSPSTPIRPDHEFEGDDYHCINCGAVDPNYCEQDEEGWYLVGTPKQMNWFAELVNTQNEQYRAMKVKLTADLDYASFDDEIYFVGRQATPFVGQFDGQFHKVSNYEVYSSENAVGFIGYINGGATIKNLVLDNTCSITGQNGVGLVAFCANAGDVLLENLGNEATITSQTGGAGGILGCNTGSKAKIYMRNCYNTGDVTGLSVNENGLLSAWLGSNGAVVENCWATGVLTGAQGPEKWLARHDNATLTNCYAVDGTQGKIVNAEEVESGALCYKLNGDQTNYTWFQTMSEDEHPTFLPSHKIVYANAKKNCDGTFDPDEVTYSNTDDSTIPDHEFVDGFCKNCGHEDASYPFLNVFPNADHNDGSGYTKEDCDGSSIVGREYNVMENWDARKFTAYQELTGLEPGTYKLRVQGYSRICAWDEKDAEGDYIYDQTDGTAIPEIYALHHNSQYYVEKDGKRIANRFMDITEGKQPRKMSEGPENMFDDESFYVPNSRRAAEQYFLKGNYWNAPLYFTVASKDDVVKVGVHNAMYIHGNWTVWDTWRLEKVEGNGIEQIRAQQVAAIQDEVSGFDAQKSLMQAYEKAAADIKTAGTIAEVEAVADILSRNPELIRKSHLAYIDFEAAIEALKELRADKELNGVYAELLDKYLEQNAAPSEELPNGTFDYIMEQKPLSVEELTAEIAFAQQLYQTAVKSSIAPGADISDLIVNPGMTESPKWTGWTKEEGKSGTAGSNIDCNNGFLDIYPVAGSWNKAFDIYQDMEEGLPNGIYELTVPAFFRPGGEGFEGGTIEDMSSAEIYVNDYYTQILNVWEDEVDYANAQNGVNCRFDAESDENAPHNGEQTTSYCFDTGNGYIPGSGRYCLSFIFNGGRYVNKAYAIVNDGKLRIGVRNTGEPWYEGEETMWGRFQLRYMGQNSAEAQDAMLSNFNRRLTKIQYANDQDIYLMYKGHFTTIQNLLADAKGKSGEEQIKALTALNEAFNKVYNSNAIYNKLFTLIDYCYDKSMEYAETDYDLADAFDLAAQEVEEIVYGGQMTDEDAQEYYDNFMMRQDLGGGYYVQGDLIDKNGNKTVYAGDTTRTYYMKKLANGKYMAENVKVQDRTNQPNANGRAGLYISCLGKNYRAEDGRFRYVTPAHNSYKIFEGAGNDLQMNGGTFNVTFDPATGEVTLDVVEYPWHDRVFVVGSVANGEGEIQTDANAPVRVRWLNNEDCALKHVGQGVYAAAVDFFQDPAHPGYMAFTIFTCRASDGKPDYTRKSTRTNWTEGRIGTLGDASIIIEENTVYDNLVRGEDRQWWLAWDNEADKQVYTVVYDMNENTMKIAKGDHTDAIDEIQRGEMTIEGIYTIDGMRVMKIQRGVNIVNGKKVVIK